MVRQNIGGAGDGLLVAPVDAPTSIKMRADFVCDGVNDEEELQAALDAGVGLGGEVVAAGGNFNLDSAGLAVTTNKRLALMGHGAVFNVGAGLTGLLINQGSLGGSTRGLVVQGVRFEGGGRANVVGVELRDTNWSYLSQLQIGSCERGILMHNATANEFVEGITLEDIVVRGSTVYGVELRRTGGTNSFGQHNWRGLAINVGGTGVGLRVGSGCSLYRSRLEVGAWVDTNQTAFNLAGDFDNAVMDLFVEGATGSTGNTALVIASTATNLAKAVLHLSFWGTIATQVVNASNLDYFYQNGRDWVGGAENTTSPLRIRRPADTAARITMGTNGSAGGRITFGNGAGANDVYLERGGANLLKAAGKLTTDLGLGVGNSAAASALGTLSKKMEIFDAAGNSLGFIPIYTTIT